MSLRELWAELEVARQRDRHRYERDVRLAWTVEYMARQKELNQAAIDRLVRSSRRQTVGEMRGVLAMLRQMHAAPRRPHA